MQMMAESSTEGGLHQGLGWIPGRVEELDRNLYKQVPHVGWNNLCIKKKAPLFERTDVDNDFYFDHSFHVNTSPDYQAATCLYEQGEITAAVQHDNIFGVQFHPEKSQNVGMRFFRSFLVFVDQYKRSQYA
jgi:glutamine amidotransferase